MDASRPVVVSATDAGDAGAGNDAAPPPARDRDASTEPLDAQAPQPGPAHVFAVDSKAEWAPSEYQVETGRCYEIDAEIDGEWLDLDVPSDLNGWTDKSDLRIALFAPLRRVREPEIGFYQFATCVDKKLDQCFAIGTSTSICPKSAGELFFFVNDVPGFESNNVGTATVTIRAK